MTGTSWWRRLRGGLGMGLTWAVGWGAVGVGIGIASRLLTFLPWDRFFAVFDAPLPALALPGFIGGTLFAVVLGAAARGGRLESLTVARVAAYGALGGLLLSLVPAGLVLAGLATIAEGGLGIGALLAVTAPPLIALGAGSAAVTLLVARRAPPGEPSALPDAPSAMRALDAARPQDFGATSDHVSDAPPSESRARR